MDNNRTSIISSNPNYGNNIKNNSDPTTNKDNDFFRRNRIDI